MKRFRRVARRRGMPVAEHFCRDNKILRRIKRLIWTDQPLIAMKIRHVVRRYKHGVVPGGIQMAVGSVNDVCLQQRHAAFGFEVGNYEFVRLALRTFLGLGLLPGERLNGKKQQ